MVFAIILEALAQNDYGSKSKIKFQKVSSIESQHKAINKQKEKEYLKLLNLL